MKILNNDQIVFLFEKLAYELVSINRDMNRVNELKDKLIIENNSSDDSLKNMNNELTRLLDELSDKLLQSAKEHPNYVMLKSIVTQLETPYYAITGNKFRDVEHKFNIEFPIDNK